MTALFSSSAHDNIPSTILIYRHMQFTDASQRLNTQSSLCMVAELKFASSSFVLLVTVGTSLRDGRPTADVAAGNVANERRDTYDSSSVGCSSTEIGGTATDTSFQSVDRHKDVDEPTIVPWSRGRLGGTLGMVR